MTQHEITGPVDLLDARGGVVEPGWARRMHVRYNREAIRANAFARKEWDFYQLRHGDWVVQLTIGHLSYAGSVSVAAFHLRTGEERGFGRIVPLPLNRWVLDRDPDRGSEVSVQRRGWGARFVADEAGRRLVVRDEASRTDVDITLVDRPGDDEMAIATPFEDPTRFYLNAKRNFWGASGRLVLGDLVIELDETTTAVLDWGRGVWPYRHGWTWGNATGWAGSRRIAFNIGWGFGDTRAATENVLFVDGEATKLGTITVARHDDDLMRPWVFSSDDGAFDLTMDPIHDHDTAIRIPPVVSTRSHQVWGTWNGTVRTHAGEVVEVRDLVAFCEHVKNRW